MIYREVTEKYERVYEVSYDIDNLEELLQKIVNIVSYRIEGKFIERSVKSKKELNSFALDKPGYMYQDIKNCSITTIYDELGDRCQALEFNATKICPPYLAHVVAAILRNEDGSVSKLLRYEDEEELIPIDQRILRLNNEINSIDNKDCDMKISALNALKELLEAKKKNRYYDAALLKNYYREALSLIELNMISEKVVTDGPKILLRDFIDKSAL